MKKWSALTNAAKGGIIAGGVALAALAVGLGVTQPWKPQAPAGQDTQVQQPQDHQPEGPSKDEPEPEAVVTVGKDDIPCTVYEGEGWSILVPEDWTMDGGTMYPAGEAPDSDGVYVSVSMKDGAAYKDAYVSIASRDNALERVFHTASANRRWEVACRAPRDRWDDAQQLMKALARTFTVDGKKPFETLNPVASEPDWQTAEGSTVLWMDKDGYIVSQDAEDFAQRQMSGWTDEEKAVYTGQYKVEDLSWAANYTCLPGDEYADVFRCRIRYEVAVGRQADAAELLGDAGTVEDGWADTGSVDIVLFHDGGAVGEVKTLLAPAPLPGEDEYLGLML